MRAVTHSADASAENAGPKCGRRLAAAMQYQRAWPTKEPAGSGSRDGPRRPWQMPVKRQRACRRRTAVWECAAQAAARVRSKCPKDTTNGRATRRPNARSPADENAAHARPARLQANLAPRAFRASESKEVDHAKVTPPARHMRSRIVCGLIFRGCGVSYISRNVAPWKRETHNSIIPAETGAVK
jgi:hypothetical protein